MDERLLVKENAKRDHRVGAVVMVLLDAIAGGVDQSQCGRDGSGDVDCRGTEGGLHGCLGFLEGG